MSSSHTLPTGKLKLALNVAIVLALLVLGGVLLRKYYFARPAQSAYRIAPHARLSIAGVDWTKREFNVLIALRQDCKYCTESVPFYRRLATALAQQGTTQVIAVFPEEERGGEAYLGGLGIPISEVRYVSLASLGINISPTLVILDRNGVVTDVRVGKMSPRVESVVMKKLDVNDPRPLSDWLVDERTLRTRIANHEALVLLDVRNRAAFSAKHEDGAKNIPVDELRVRAVNELTAAEPVVLFGDDYETDLAYSILDSQGFAKIAIRAPN